MNLTFLGAAREVTGSSYLVEAEGVRFLVDCGMFQGGREAREKNRLAFGFDPGSIDFVLLTHAHIDHSGLLRHPLSATPLRRLGAAFVKRFDAARGAEDTEVLEARLGAGDALVFFPEGTFRDAPGLLPFRMGAFVAAARAGAPIVPVTLTGTRALLPGQRRWPRYSPLAVTIHAPLIPAGKDWQAALALRDAARAVILAQSGEADAGL